MPDLHVFDVIDRLTAELPPTPDKVAQALGTRLARDRDSDTAAIEAYAQPENARGSRYEVVDLRMPDADIGDGAVFLSVTLRSDEGVDQAAVIERYGSDFQSEIPSPRYPPGAIPVYLTYAREWGTLAFGVTNDAARKLVRFVVTTHPLAD
jgi:hypothetical protein